MSSPNSSANAFIDGDFIVIRVPIAHLPLAVAGLCDDFTVPPMRVTDPEAFARTLCDELNADDRGATPVTALFDTAFRSALESGGEGIEAAVRCEACARVLPSTDASFDDEDGVYLCAKCGIELAAEGDAP